MEHLQKHNLLIDNQHGFRSGYSCQSQLISLTEDLLHAMDNHHQIDLILLDFTKAFDKVPHRRLLTKLSYYGIRDHIHAWIETWLTQRSQQVVIDGESSYVASVKSGVPQGTVLGPLMFLIYVNDIAVNILSPLRLFADDCLLYRVIKSKADASHLQLDLDYLSQWAQSWQMKFNLNKCTVIRCTRSRSPASHDYTLQGHLLETKTQSSYLGLTFHNTLTWSFHINNIVNRASKILNFLRRNLYKCSQEVKTAAYISLVRPLMEYASIVWDPHQITYINSLERIQRRAARWTTSDYSRLSSVTAILQSLKWPTLELRRKVARLSFFHKIMYNLSPVHLPSYFCTTNKPTRYCHPLHIIIPFTSTSAYQASFFPRTIKDWNILPESLIEINNNNLFTLELSNLLIN